MPDLRQSGASQENLRFGDQSQVSGRKVGLSQLVSRKAALDLVANALYTGAPMHPRMHDHLREIIGEVTPEEESRLGAARRAGEAAAERSREQMRELARTGERFRKALGYD